MLDVLPNPPRTTQCEGKQTAFEDSSGPLFFMYQKMTEEEDNKMIESWKSEAESTIIFVSSYLAFYLHFI